MKHILPALISWNHLHPVLVHFTTALLPVSFFSDAAGKCLRRNSLIEAGYWVMLYAAIGTPLTAAAGWFWLKVIAGAGARISPTLATHEWLGMGLTFCYLFLGAWRSRTYSLREAPGIRYLIACAVVTAALFYQGYLGGSLTIG